MGMKKTKRGLSPRFMKNLKENGELHSLLLAVLNDDTICMEIRENYINIYYRGGNLCKISESGDHYIYHFDSNYALDKEVRESLLDFANFDCEMWLRSFPLLKSIMDSWFNKYPKEEREIQQHIVRENNFSVIAGDTDYFIVDLEYTSSESEGRFDMIAIKWQSTSQGRKNRRDKQLVLIEVKYGDKAMGDKSGIAQHFGDWTQFVSDKARWNSFCNEMLKVFNQKVELGLIKGLPGAIESVSYMHPEMLFLLANHKPARKKFHNELNAILNDDSKAFQDTDVYIASSSMMGYGLYASEMIPVPEYLKGQRKIYDK